MGRAEVGAGFGGKDQEFSLRHIKPKVSVSYPKISILFHLVWVGGINLGIDVISMVLKVTKLDN